MHLYKRKNQGISFANVEEEVSDSGESLEKYAYVHTWKKQKYYIPDKIGVDTPFLLENGNYSLKVSPLFTQNAEIVQQDKALEQNIASGQDKALEQNTASERNIDIEQDINSAQDEALEQEKILQQEQDVDLEQDKVQEQNADLEQDSISSQDGVSQQDTDLQDTTALQQEMSVDQEAVSVVSQQDIILKQNEVLKQEEDLQQNTALEQEDVLQNSMSNKETIDLEIPNLSSVKIAEGEMKVSEAEGIEKVKVATYTAADEAFQLEYIPYQSSVKENLILNKKPDTNSWRFFITFGGGLKARKNDNNEGISFYAEDAEGKDVLVGGIQAPFMNDASNEHYSEDITYDLETVSEQNGSYILTMTVSQEYLDSPNTQYPVTIDPSYTWTGSSSVQDVYVLSNSSYANWNFYNSSTTGMFAGRTNTNGYERTYISFDGLASKVKGYSVASAKLTVYETGGGTAGETVQAHTVNAAWDKATLTWNNKPAYSKTVLSSFTNTAKANQAGVLDLTSYVRKVAQGTSDYGIMLRTKDETVGKYAKFYGSRHSSTAYRPKLVVTYKWNDCIWNPVCGCRGWL